MTNPVMDEEIPLVGFEQFARKVKNPVRKREDYKHRIEKYVLELKVFLITVEDFHERFTIQKEIYAAEAWLTSIQ